MKIVAVNLLNVPSVGLITGRRIFTLGHWSHRIEGYVVGIVEEDQVIELEVRGERGGLEEMPSCKQPSPPGRLRDGRKSCAPGY